MKIIINGKTFDFSERTVQALLSSGIEGTEFHKQSGRRMLPVALPLTANNQRVNSISDWGSYLPSNDLSYENIFPIVIEEKGSELLSGNGRMKDVTKDTFTIEAWGEASDWVPAMREVLLSDLAPPDFLWDSADIDATILACATATPYDAGLERCYPAIVYKPVTDGYWLYENMLPAIPVLSLIERFFGSIQPIGFTIQSEFLYSNFFKRLILPYCWGTFGRRDEEYNILNTDFMASITTVWYGSSPPLILPDNYIIHWDDETTAPNFDNVGMYDNSTGISVITENGFYRVRVENLTHLPLVSGQGYLFAYLYMNVNGTRVFLRKVSSNGGVANYDAYHEFFAGDIVYFEGVYDPFVTWGNAPVLHDAGTVSIKKALEYQIGDTVSWAEILPNTMYFDDFWTGLKQLFNLYIETDKARGIVTIEPLFSWEYFGQTGKGFIDETLAVDVLDQIQNLASDTIISFEDLKRTLKFKFRNDTRDGYMSKVEKDFNIDLYSVQYTFPPTFESGHDDDVNKIFSAVVHTVIRGSAFPVFVSDIEANVEGNYDTSKTNFQSLKLLFYRGTAYGDWMFNGALQTDYPKAFALDILGESSLHPALTYSSHDFGGNHYQGCFAKHWWRYIASLKLPFYKKLSVRMPNTYFATLSHRNLRSYNGILCLLESVDNYSPVKESDANFKLRQFITPLDGDEVFIEETPNDGIVILIPLECFAQLSFSCSSVVVLGDTYYCVTPLMTQSENSNAELFVWDGAIWIPYASASMFPDLCKQPSCDVVCTTPDSTIALNPTNDILSITTSSPSAGVYQFDLLWNGTADAALITLIEEWYASCNQMLVLWFASPMVIPFLKYQVTSFLVDGTGIYITYDSNIPLQGYCQSIQQDVLDTYIIPNFTATYVAPIKCMFTSCCVFELTDNIIQFKVLSCDGQEAIYVFQFTDSEDPCSNYVVTQLPSG